MSNDTMLQQAVLAELSWEPSITAGHINQVTIKPQVRPSEIQEKIKAALQRSWYEPVTPTAVKSD